MNNNKRKSTNQNNSRKSRRTNSLSENANEISNFDLNSFILNENPIDELNGN